MKDQEKKKKIPIGKKIKAFRENLNFSERYMAEKLGISQPAYSNIETDASSLSIDKLFQIAEVFNVSVHSILDFDGSRVFNIYNSTAERGVIGNNNILQNEDKGEEIKTLYEKLLAEKDELIRHLKSDNERLKAENVRFKQ